MSAITIVKVAQKYSSHGEKTVNSRINDMLIRSPMIPVDRKIATLAGMLRHKEIQGGKSGCNHPCHCNNWTPHDCDWRSAL